MTIHPLGWRLKVFVVCAASNELSIINTAKNEVDATVSIGNNPISVVSSYDGSKAYVTDNNDRTVSVINTIENRVETTIGLVNYPYGLAISPDGKKAYGID